MIFLPIVQRELQVAARKRSTFWVRVTAAIVALIVGSCFLLLWTLVPFGLSPPSLGRGLFATLTWLNLGIALSAGLFFTSDCLSEEKREGTLGFLFLTDLRGFDVVLGKLLATSLRGTFALIAVFPILAVTLLMGGLTGLQFWKTVLALVNALFISLSAGLFVSALSRESQKALAGTLLLLLLLVGLGPATDSVLAMIRKSGFVPVLSYSSPGFLFVAAGAWRQIYFWPAFLTNQLIAWTLLGLTCLLLPRTWQEKTARTTSASGSWSYRWKFGGTKRRSRLRRKLVGLNPAQWLASRERWQAATLWVVALVMLAGMGPLLVNPKLTVWWYVWSYLAGLLMLVLYLGIASQASRFLVEARRNGLTELLLATPLTERQIVRGQWRGMLRMLGPPLALCLAAQLAGTFVTQQRTMSQMAAATATMSRARASSATNAPIRTNSTVIVRSPGISVTVTPPGAGGPAPNLLLPMGAAVAVVLSIAANLVALAWFGMWMGLTSKSTNLATLKTIAFVQIIPWFVIAFASALIIPLLLIPTMIRGMGSAATTNVMFWYPFLSVALSCTLALAKDAGFFLWARRKLHAEFRDRATESIAPVRPPTPPSLPPSSPPPLPSTT